MAPRILVTGGAPGERQALVEWLEEAGYPGAATDDGGGAPADLALVIYGWPPASDGPSASDRTRAHAGARTVAMLSGTDNLPGRIEEALAQGADGVLPMPVSVAALGREVERQLGLA